ncbi:MAG: hypothetical protein GY705_10685 [Bacteroidetes bacterium]|nr:hypothetical protein [Bacteroidota bacterium]
MSSNRSLPLKKNKFRNLIFLGLSLLAICMVLAYTGIRIWIKTDVNKICKIATHQYSGDKVEALTVLLQSDKQSLKEKNQAIWALGELKDERAVSLLKKLRNGEECDHSKFVCQYELDKALQKIEGKWISSFAMK